MKKFLIVLGVLILLVIGGLLAAPQFINWNNYKDDIVKVVSEQSGFDLSIQGDLHFNILPFPELVISGVSVKAPKGSTENILAAFDEIEAQVELLPLLSREVVVSKLEIERPVVNLEVFKDGKQNWITETLARKQSATSVNETPSVDKKSPIKDIRISKFFIEQALFSYRDQRDDSFESVSIVKLLLKVQSLQGPFSVDGKLNYEEKDINLNLKTGSIEDLSAVSINASISAIEDSVTFGFDGVISAQDDIGAQGAISLGVTALSKILGDDAPDEDAQISFQAALDASPTKVDIRNAVLNLGDSSADIDLKISGLEEGQTKDIKFVANFENAISLDGWIPELEIDDESDQDDESSGEASNKPLLPETFISDLPDFPKDVKVLASVTAPQLVFKNKKFNDVSVLLDLKEGTLKSRLQIKDIPGQGAVSISAQLPSGSQNGIATHLVFNAKDLTVLTKDLIDLEKEQEKYLELVSSIDVDVTTLLTPQKLDLTSLSLETPIADVLLSGDFGAGVQGKINVKSKLDIKDLPKIDKALELNLPEPFLSQNKSAQILSNLNGTPEKLSYVVNASAVKADVKASGDVTDVLAEPKIGVVSLQLKHPKPSNVIKLFSPEFQSSPGLENQLDIYAKVKLEDTKIEANNFILKTKHADLKGNLAFDTSNDIPQIAANLESEQIDLNQFLAKPSTSKSTKTKTLSKANSDQRWSDEPIDVSALKTVNADIALKAKSLKVQNFDFRNLVTSLKLKDGDLKIDKIEADTFGGKLKGDLALLTKSNPLNLESNISLDNAFLKNISNMFGQDALSGKASLTTDIITQGKSIKDLIGALSGSGALQSKDLKISGFDLNALSDNIKNASGWQGVAGALVSGPLTGGSTTFNDTNVTYNIKSGVVTLDKAELKNNIANVGAGGIISLKDWKMDINGNLALLSPEGVPPFSATLSGPLDNPVQNFKTDALKSFAGSFVNDLLQRSDTAKQYEGLIRGVLGQPAPAQPQSKQPAANDNNNTEVTPQPQISPEEQIFKGILNQLSR